jgi:hypothetical protein
MSSTQIAGLRDLRERQAIAVQQMLESAQRAGRTQMVQTEKRAIKDLRDLDSRIAYLESEQQRAGTLPGGALAQLSSRINQQQLRARLTPGCSVTPRPTAAAKVSHSRANLYRALSTWLGLRGIGACRGSVGWVSVVWVRLRQSVR